MEAARKVKRSIRLVTLPIKKKSMRGREDERGISFHESKLKHDVDQVEAGNYALVRQPLVKPKSLKLQKIMNIYFVRAYGKMRDQEGKPSASKRNMRKSRQDQSKCAQDLVH